MEQILLHMIGDYVTQTHWMALNKIKSWKAAGIHAAVYSLPFLALGSLAAWSVIALTHVVIDRFSLAKYLVWAKNRCTPGGCSLEEALTNHGYAGTVPAFISFWLYVAADNTMHLCINYAALRWL